MNNAFFFQTQQIPDSSSIFNQLKEQKIFFLIFRLIKIIISFFIHKNPLISIFSIN